MKLWGTGKVINNDAAVQGIGAVQFIPEVGRSGKLSARYASFSCANWNQTTQLMLTLMEKLLPDDKVEIIIRNSREYTSHPTTEGKGQQKAPIIDPLLFLADDDIDGDNDGDNTEPVVQENCRSNVCSTAHNIPSARAACPAAPPVLPTVPAAHTAAPPIRPAAPATRQAAPHIRPAAPTAHQVAPPVVRQNVTARPQATNGVPRNSSTGSSSSGARRIPSTGASSAPSRPPSVPSSASSRTSSTNNSRASSLTRSNVPAQGQLTVKPRPKLASQSQPVRQNPAV